MSNPRSVALLDANGVVINTIVVDDSTPEDFLTQVVEDTEEFPEVIETVEITEELVAAPGWKRNDNGKFEEPISMETVSPIDHIGDIVSDDRLKSLDDNQKVVLEDVLSERIGRPTPKPEKDDEDIVA